SRLLPHVQGSSILTSPDIVFQSGILTFSIYSKRFSIEKQYADTIIEKYSAKVEALDFDQRKETAEVLQLALLRIMFSFCLQIIDAFVMETTEGKIKNFIKEDTVSGAISLIVNAIYFKAKWEHEFSKEKITNSTFYSAANKEKEIEFLNEDNTLRNYTEDKDMEVLSLPYKDTSYAFNVFLPKRRFALDILRRKLTGATIQNLLSNLQPALLTTSFPKMKIETNFELKEALIAMGVTKMFSDSANLTGIAKYLPLTVSDAAHKAIIEVGLILFHFH
ncbi:serine proteinase inhibitor, partial [Ancylostoma duodenale]